MKIKKINKVVLDKPKQFWDIEVDNTHNFAVYNSKCIVHNSSLENSMIGMGQDFKNSMPLIKGIGQFGSLRSPTAGAARYISGKLHPNFRLLYKDFNLLENKVEEGQKIEPKFFLPIVPTVILNGSSGIAVGFATNILNRNPDDVIEGCIAHLNNKKIPELTPWLSDFYGTFRRNEDSDNFNAWEILGEYEVKNTTTVKITEIPPNFTYERYEKHLNNLAEKKIINSYDDNSSERVEYIVKFSRASLKEYVSKNKLEKVLKLKSRETENLTTVDESGKLRIFKSAADIIKYFVDFRLQWYEKRKSYLIDTLNKESIVLNNKAKFIKEIIDKKLEINNIPKQKIIDYLTDNKYDLIDDSYSYLLSMAIHTLTKERFDNLLNQVKEKQKQLTEIKNKKPKDMYLKDLHDLKDVIKKQK